MFPRSSHEVDVHTQKKWNLTTEPTPHVTSTQPRPAPPRQAIQLSRSYKVLLLLALLFLKPSKRSEPATTYAHALNPRFRRPTAQGCQSLSRGVAL